MVFDFKPPKNVNVNLEIGIATSTKCPHHAIELILLIEDYLMKQRIEEPQVNTHLKTTLQIFEEDGHLYLKLISWRYEHLLKCKAYGVQAFYKASVIIRNYKSSVPYLMVLKLLLRIHR